jgi:hypothetical protein
VCLLLGLHTFVLGNHLDELQEPTFKDIMVVYRSELACNFSCMAASS